jgi:hypothetical protein
MAPATQLSNTSLERVSKACRWPSHRPAAVAHQTAFETASCAQRRWAESSGMGPAQPKIRWRLAAKQVNPPADRWSLRPLLRLTMSKRG